LRGTPSIQKRKEYGYEELFDGVVRRFCVRRPDLYVFGRRRYDQEHLHLLQDRRRDDRLSFLLEAVLEDSGGLLRRLIAEQSIVD